MLNFDVKRKINTLRDILVGKVPDPKAQVEQITIALIYKFMDDMDLSGSDFGGKRVFFSGEYEKYAFSQIMLPEHSAQERLNLYAEGIDKMSNNADLPQLFRDILRGAYIPYRDPETLNMFLKEIAEFSYSDSEDLGNAFEYLLSIMGSQGDAGQFRTPRHIINMMVDITAPQKNESVLDPACGTAGFLISAFKHIEAHNRDKDGTSTLTADDKNRMVANFAGYDISPDMVRLSRVNMYLHGFSKPLISEYDTLTSLDKWDDTYDVIFANPPFMTPKGGIIPHNRYRISAKRSEVLFVDYIAEHLNPTGRAAVIVPEGIVFQSATAYKNLRKYLVDDGLLYAVISLPAGVFNPYSGVKTSILLMDKTLAKEQDSILFVKLSNDGFDLGAQRRKITGSEIPDVISVIQDYQKGVSVAERTNVTLVPKTDIAAQDYILVGERYKVSKTVDTKWQMVRLGDVCEFLRGLTYTKDDESSAISNNAVLRANNIDLDSNSINFNNLKYLSNAGNYNDDKRVRQNDILICASSGSKQHLGKVALIPQNVNCFFGGFMGVLRPNQRVLPQYLYRCVTSDEYRAFVASLISGANINNIRSKELLSFHVPLPPLSVQEEIVAKIDGYQKIIDGAKQVVDNYKPAIKIDPAWKMVRLGDVCELQAGGTPSRGNAEYWEKNDYAWYTSGELNDIYTTDPEKYISADGFEHSSARLFPAGSLLIGMYDTAAFKMSILDREATFNQAVCGIKPSKQFDMLFLLLFFSENRDKYLNLRVGARQRNLTKQFISGLSVPIPSIETQREIVASINEEMSIVEQNKKLIEIFQQKIKDKIADVWEN